MALGLFPIFSKPVFRSFFGLLDQLRRDQGKIWESVNLGPRETPSREVFQYAGDTGVALQHLGMLVGQKAHMDLWPEIIRWIHSHC